MEDFFSSFYTLDTWPTSRHMSLDCSESVLPRKIYFVSVQVPIILNVHSLNIFNFRDFSKNPVFGGLPDAPKIVKILTISEFNEILLGY